MQTTASGAFDESKLSRGTDQVGREACWDVIEKRGLHVRGMTTS